MGGRFDGREGATRNSAASGRRKRANWKATEYGPRDLTGRAPRDCDGADAEPEVTF